MALDRQIEVIHAKRSSLIQAGLGHRYFPRFGSRTGAAKIGDVADARGDESRLRRSSAFMSGLRASLLISAGGLLAADAAIWCRGRPTGNESETILRLETPPAG
jgi:hypothetical protein